MAEKRVSGSVQGVLPLVTDTTQRLELLGDERSLAMADEGKLFMSALDSWPISAPSQDEKLLTYRAILEWHRRAQEHMSGPR